MGAITGRPALAARVPARPGSLLPGRGAMIGLAVGPLIIFYAIFLLFPLGWSFYMSVHDWPGATFVREPSFVGLENYRRAVFEDRLLRKAIGNTALYAALAIPFNLLLALALAVMINALPRLRGLYRTLYFLPVLVSEVTASILWRYVYQPRFGLINGALIRLSDATGIALPLPRWLDDPGLAIPAIVGMTTWKTMGYTLVIVLAGLQGIPEVFYEAARIDGATGWRLFRHITLPLLRPTLAFLLMTQTIGALQVFGPMYVMTKGGPVDSTRSVVYHLYDQAFANFRFGYASSLAVILFLVILVLALLQTRLLATRWEY
ncbi:MAG TPA: sugar ABC transporter permease [Thermomicrobiales bacterium]|jgi:ABC-type sugar transport system permease subunit